MGSVTLRAALAGCTDHITRSLEETKTERRLSHCACWHAGLGGRRCMPPAARRGNEVTMVEITRTRSAGTARCAVVCVRRGRNRKPSLKAAGLRFRPVARTPTPANGRRASRPQRDSLRDVFVSSSLRVEPVLPVSTSLESAASERAPGRCSTASDPTLSPRIRSHFGLPSRARGYCQVR